jgi:hypothetical protein
MLPVGGSGWHTLIAGNPSFATAVVEKTKVLMRDVRYSECELSADTMMLCMSDAYKQCRESLTETEILSPYFLTRKLWAERPNTLLPIRATISETIQLKLERFSAKTSLLVFGFNRESNPKPHLFSVVDPGVGRNHDISGNHAVGIGAPTAISHMAFWDVDREDSLDRTLYEVFHAKATSEMVQGVGVSWDAWIELPGTRPINVRRDIHDMLDRVYSFQAASPYERDKFGERERPPKDWYKRLKKYTDEVLSRTTQPQKPASRMSKSKR